MYKDGKTYAVIFGYKWTGADYIDAFKTIDSLKFEGVQHEKLSPLTGGIILNADSLFNEPSYAIFGRLIASDDIAENKINAGSPYPFIDIEMNEARLSLMKAELAAAWNTLTGECKLPEPSIIFTEIDNGRVWTFANKGVI